MSARVFFAWYDFWVGVYYDRTARALYICPLPMLVIRLCREQELGWGKGGFHRTCNYCGNTECDCVAAYL